MWKLNGYQLKSGRGNVKGGRKATILKTLTVKNGDEYLNARFLDVKMNLMTKGVKF